MSLATQLTRNIRLNLPLVSAAMDTVTESRLAIALAQEGGIGIIHKNMSPAVRSGEVSRSSATSPASSRIRSPSSRTLTVGEVIRPVRRKSLRPAGDEHGKVVGIVTNRDLRFESRLDPGAQHR